MTQHVRSTHRIRLPAPADRAFRFFTPAGESLWVEGWQPRYVRPADGRTQAGMVFLTGSVEAFTLWLLADFDPARRRSRYIRTTPAWRVGTVEIACEPDGPEACQVDVAYDLTAVSEAGAATLEEFRGDAFARMIEGWGERIRARLPQLLQADIA